MAETSDGLEKVNAEMNRDTRKAGMHYLIYLGLAAVATMVLFVSILGALLLFAVPTSIGYVLSKKRDPHTFEKRFLWLFQGAHYDPVRRV